jgi:zinc transporter 9
VPGLVAPEALPLAAAARRLAAAATVGAAAATVGAAAAEGAARRRAAAAARAAAGRAVARPVAGLATLKARAAAAAAAAGGGCAVAAARRRAARRAAAGAVARPVALVPTLETGAAAAGAAAAAAAGGAAAGGRGHKRELHAVNVALAVNGAILVAKLSAWAFTRSGALLAEALHSGADIANQLLLRAGVNQSRRAPTRQHPYGFHREKYVYALISAVGVFCLGAGASVVHGISALLDPPVLEHYSATLAVLGVSAVAELWSVRVALAAIRAGAAEQREGVAAYLRGGRDPTTAAVLAEDAAAVAGLAVAGAASAATWVTGNATYDALGSIGVGALMGCVAVALIRANKDFLIGKAMPSAAHARLVAHLEADPTISRLVEPKSEALGNGVYRFKADVQWDADEVVARYLARAPPDSPYARARAAAAPEAGPLRDALDAAAAELGRGAIRTVGEEVDRLEEELRAIEPGLLWCDLESDRKSG